MPVGDAAGQLIGFVSLSDIVRYIPPPISVLRSGELDTDFVSSIPYRYVSEVMQPHVLVTYADSHISDAVELLTNRQLVP